MLTLRADRCRGASVGYLVIGVSHNTRHVLIELYLKVIELCGTVETSRIELERGHTIRFGAKDLYPYILR